MIKQIGTFPLTAKLGLLFNPSRTEFKFFEKEVPNFETGPYKREWKI
jgi:hypothetical protein